MPTLTLQFSYPLNTSVAVGDTAYYVPTSTTAGFDVNSSDVVEIGTILTVDFISNTITVDTVLGNGVVTTSHFILFSKDNAACLSSLLGYFAEVKMTNTNNSTAATELYQVGLDIFESSK